MKPLKKRLFPLKTQKDYQRIKSQGEKIFNFDFVVYFIEGNNQAGLRVSKVYGNAVKRNRLRRVLKEALRVKQYGLDLIVIVKKKNPAKSPEILRDSLLHLLERVTDRSVKTP